MKLIVEQIDHDSLEYLVEENKEQNTKIYRIRGPFLQSEMKNKNGRIYSREIIEREVKRYNEEMIKTKRACGELNHPQSPSVNLDRVSHLIESLKMEGNNAVGVAKILDTPMGKIAQTLIDSGISLGVSSRGVGSLTGNKVNDDYFLAAVDAVHEPSAPECYVQGILENKEFFMQDGHIVEKAVEDLEKHVAKTGTKELKRGIEIFLETVRENLKNER